MSKGASSPDVNPEMKSSFVLPMTITRTGEKLPAAAGFFSGWLIDLPY